MRGRRFLIRNDDNQVQTYMETCDMEFSRLHGVHRCRTAEEAPCFKPGKWSINAQHRIALYGHDAKSMKNFTLHFDYENQCESLDRMWFGEVWFPVEKCVRSPIILLSRPCISTQQNLISNLDMMSQICAFRDLKCRDPACALLDSGATHVLLPGPYATQKSTFIRGHCQPCCRQRESTMLEK